MNNNINNVGRGQSAFNSPVPTVRRNILDSNDGRERFIPDGGNVAQGHRRLALFRGDDSFHNVGFRQRLFPDFLLNQDADNHRLRINEIPWPGDRERFVPDEEGFQHPEAPRQNVARHHRIRRTGVPHMHRRNMIINPNNNRFDPFALLLRNINPNQQIRNAIQANLIQSNELQANTREILSRNDVRCSITQNTIVGLVNNNARIVLLRLDDQHYNLYDADELTGYINHRGRLLSRNPMTRGVIYPHNIINPNNVAPENIQ